MNIKSKCGADLSFKTLHDDNITMYGEVLSHNVDKINECVVAAIDFTNGYIEEQNKLLDRDILFYNDMFSETTPSVDEIVEKENLDINEELPYYAVADATPQHVNENDLNPYASEQNKALLQEVYDAAYDCNDVLNEDTIDVLGEDYIEYCDFRQKDESTVEKGGIEHIASIMDRIKDNIKEAIVDEDSIDF